MSLASFCVRKPVTTFMMVLLVSLFGVISWQRLPQELYPPLNFPQLSIVTSYANAAPEEIETLLTKVIEESIGTVKNLRRVSSVSKEGVSVVTVEFVWGTNMDFASLAVREKVDLIKDNLPQEAGDPIVMKFNPFDLPVVILSVTGPQSPLELLNITQRIIKDKIEKTEGVASASISGGQEREIQVEIDQGRLQAARVSILAVTEAIKNSNLSYPGGSIKDETYEYLIRTKGEYQSIQEIKNTPVELAYQPENKDVKYARRTASPLEAKTPTAKRHVILLNSLAEVKDGLKERTTFSRYNGLENISMAIQKQSDANTIRTVKKVYQTLESIQSSLPAGVKIGVIYDQSIFIKAAIKGLIDDSLQGGILAFLVLLVFLKNFRTALIVSTTIPISVLATLGLMYFTKLSVNLMSLGGIAFGVGSLVDAAIVVVDNIHRRRKAYGEEQFESAIKGTDEMSAAVTSSILTTVAVFLPLLFVVGVAGQVFKELSLTVTYSLLASLWCAVTLVPTLVSKVKEKEITEWKFLAKYKYKFDFLKKYLKKPVIEYYRDFLNKFVDHYKFSLGVVLLIFLFSLILLLFVEREFMPKVDQRQFIIQINMQMGTKLTVTDGMVKSIEGLLKKIPEIKESTVNVGSSSDKTIETLGAHQGRIIVNLYKKEEWKEKGFPQKMRSTNEVIQEVESNLGRIEKKGAEVVYLLQDSPFKFMMQVDAPIAIELKGNNLTLLKKYSEEITEKIRRIPGIYGVKSNLSLPSPETRLEVNRDRAAAYNLSVTDIARTAMIAVKGYIASRYKEEGREYDILVRLRREDRQDNAKLRTLTVHSPLNIDIPLQELGVLASGRGPSEIRHLDQQRTIILSANFFKRSLNEVITDIDGILGRYKKINGYSFILTGEQQQIKESFVSMAFALIFSVILIYMIMASQFESFWQPLIIMFTVPLTLIGTVLALMLTRTTLNAVSILGVIIMAGIVVNNGIVLIDYINAVKLQGVPVRQAIVDAAVVRFRPVMMTAIATVLGLVPLALGIGEGAELRAPLAITIIGGLSLATVLTLAVIPTLYLIVDGWLNRKR
ncbi:MAG: efflux RND transporter permease subunit [Elusimicrobiota bacterium]